MNMNWVDWVSVAICVYLLGDCAMAGLRYRKQRREFKAWLKEMQAKHKVGLS